MLHLKERRRSRYFSVVWQPSGFPHAPKKTYGKCATEIKLTCSTRENSEEQQPKIALHFHARQLFRQVRQVGVGLVHADEQRVAVGRRACHRFGGKRDTRAGAVLHHGGLAAFVQLLRKGAADQIGDAAGRRGNDDLDRLGGKLLRRGVTDQVGEAAQDGDRDRPQRQCAHDAPRVAPMLVVPRFRRRSIRTTSRPRDQFCRIRDPRSTMSRAALQLTWPEASTAMSFPLIAISPLFFTATLPSPTLALSSSRASTFTAAAAVTLTPCPAIACRFLPLRIVK